MAFLWLGIALVALWALFDVRQKRHAILHNFPIIGHFRYWLESIGPELRQYIVTSNNEERPFSRDERSWVYASSKKENNYVGFGTDNDLERSPNHLIVKHSAFPLDDPLPGDEAFDALHRVPCAKVLGAPRGRRQAFRMASIVNISAMSFGSLSAQAVSALNRGAKLADCLHNTGEGGLTPHHAHGGELIWQVGTGYFGCRTPEGRFDPKMFVDKVQAFPVRAIEIKLSQGAKPGRGGLLPAAKITREIAAIRGVPMGKDCHSPAAHSEFRDVDEMLDFAERLAELSGLPVGIKSAVGELDFWRELAERMDDGQRGVDFITIDGGEGGTGAAPLTFTDHVSLPFKIGFTRVHNLFMESGLHQRVVFLGSGKLGFPQQTLLALALGCDGINVAREAMLSIGCIQAQRCQSGHCPTGVATQNYWLRSGLDPEFKSHRAANYVVTLRKELLQLARACGRRHPALVDPSHLEIVDERFGAQTISQVFALRSEPLLADQDREAIDSIMRRIGAPST